MKLTFKTLLIFVLCLRTLSAYTQPTDTIAVDTNGNKTSIVEPDS